LRSNSASANRARKIVLSPDVDETGNPKASEVIHFEAEGEMCPISSISSQRSVRIRRSPSPVEGVDVTPPLYGANVARTARDATPAASRNSLWAEQHPDCQPSPGPIGDTSSISYITYLRQEYGETQGICDHFLKSYDRGRDLGSYSHPGQAFAAIKLGYPYGLDARVDAPPLDHIVHNENCRNIDNLSVETLRVWRQDILSQIIVLPIR
jgi:hypothetical protein